MDVSMAFWYAVGIIFLLLLLHLLAKPLEVMLKITGSSVVAGVALWVINLVGGHVGFHLGLNPVTAVLAGLLGVPGVIGLGLLRWILG